jgi:hypothetical protein
VLTPAFFCEAVVRDVDVAAVWVQRNAKVRVPQGRPDGQYATWTADLVRSTRVRRLTRLLRLSGRSTNLEDSSPRLALGLVEHPQHRTNIGQIGHHDYTWRESRHAVGKCEMLC